MYDTNLEVIVEVGLTNGKRLYHADCYIVHTANGALQISRRGRFVVRYDPGEWQWWGQVVPKPEQEAQDTDLVVIDVQRSNPPVLSTYVYVMGDRHEEWRLHIPESIPLMARDDVEMTSPMRPVKIAVYEPTGRVTEEGLEYQFLYIE